MDNCFDDNNLRLILDKFHVYVRARGGLTIKTPSQDPTLTNFDEHPYIVFLQIGGNDLCQPNNTPDKICRDILSFANFLRYGKDIHTVIIGQVLRRQPWASSPDFNNCVHVLNYLLDFRIRNCDSYDNIHFWHHRGFRNPTLSHLDPRDGVHLLYHRHNISIMRRYLQSTKSAILHFN